MRLTPGIDLLVIDWARVFYFDQLSSLFFKRGSEQKMKEYSYGVELAVLYYKYIMIILHHEHHE